MKNLTLLFILFIVSPAAYRPTSFFAQFFQSERGASVEVFGIHSKRESGGATKGIRELHEMEMGVMPRGGKIEEEFEYDISAQKIPKV